MKRIALLFSLATLASVPLLGCKKKETPPDPPAPTTPTTPSSSSGTLPGDTARVEDEAAYQSLVTQFDGVTKNFGELEGLMDKLGDAVPTDLKDVRSKIEGQIAAAQQKLNEIRTASGETWKNLQSQLSSSMEEIQSSISDVMTELKSTTPPIPGQPK